MGKEKTHQHNKTEQKHKPKPGHNQKSGKFKQILRYSQPQSLEFQENHGAFVRKTQFKFTKDYE